MDAAKPGTGQGPAAQPAQNLISGYQAILNLKRGGMLVALLVIMLFGVTFSWHTWQHEKNQALQHFASLVELGANSMDNYFSQYENAFSLLSQNLLDQDQLRPERARILLQRFKAAYPDLRDVSLFALDGKLLASAGLDPTEEPYPSIGKTSSFMLSRAELLKGRTFDIARPLFSVMHKEWIVALHYGMRDKKGNLLYIIGAPLPLSKTQSFWKDAPLPQGAALALIRDDLYLVSRYPVPEKTGLEEVYGKPRTGALAAWLLQHNFPAGGIVEGGSSLHGDTSIYAFRRLPRHPVTFVMNTPKSHVYALWWDGIRFSYLLLILVLAGGFFVYRWLLQRQTEWELERETTHRELEQLSRTDALTGALNRRAVHEEIGNELSRSARSGQVLSVIAFDLDNFKMINDVYGHPAGDKALQAFVASVRTEIRPYDAVGRTGGEEFVLLLPNANAMVAQIITERIRTGLERNPIGPGGKTVTVSAGVMDSSEIKIQNGLEQVLAVSDARLYEAKRVRNAVVGPP